MHCCQLWGWQHRKIEWVVLIEYSFISATVVCSWIKLINEWREVAAASLVILGLWPSSFLSCSLGFKVNKHEDNPWQVLIVLKRNRRNRQLLVLETWSSLTEISFQRLFSSPHRKKDTLFLEDIRLKVLNFKVDGDHKYIFLPTLLGTCKSRAFQFFPLEFNRCARSRVSRKWLHHQSPRADSLLRAHQQHC